MKKVTVLGAGSVGFALAGYFGIQGLNVCLYELPEFEESIKDIKETGFIEVTDAVEGIGKVNLVTTNIEEALKGADVIIVAVPAYAHRKIALACADYLTDEQVVVINSGSVFAPLEFSNVLKEAGNHSEIVIAESSNITGCRKVSPQRVRIMGINMNIKVATLSNKHTAQAVERLSGLFDEVTGADNILETSLSNISVVVHPAPAILNAGWIESTDGFDFYWGGMSPSVCNVLEAVDEERVSLGQALGFKPKSFLEAMEKEDGTIYDYISSNPSLGGPKIGTAVCPTSLDYRYITEDVPYGFVPYSELAHKLGVSTPHMDALIILASQLNGVDYRRTGRNLSKMGLQDLSTNEMKQILLT